MARFITRDPSDDGIDRRGFLTCMAWAGTGMLWSMRGGLLASTGLRRASTLLDDLATSDLFFVQISDSHIGFSKDANRNVTATLEEAVRRIDALPTRPAFLIHTGDISQLSRPDEFDTARQVIAQARTRTGHVFWVPGEHDVIGDNGAAYLARFGTGATGGGWYSMDIGGVHFIALVNVLDLAPGGLGRLGREQLEWLARDVRHLSSSTPIVVFAHVPLWAVYPAWGWGTDDAAEALALLRRFGSVTVLNGHIHQVLQKVEGHVHFHTAMSTAFPQPAPGTAPSPGPLAVPAEQLRSMLGLTSVTVHARGHALALVDSTLAGGAAVASTAAGDTTRRDRGSAPLGPNVIAIDNFRFTPAALSVARGTTVTWLNRDDVPHLIASADKRFAASPALDTGDHYERTFDATGTYRYYCAIHPTMVGTVSVS